jgi:hypothetical protein
MEINIDHQKLKPDVVSIRDLKSLLNTGKAILFTGAGFSKGTSNLKDKEPPLAKELAKEISLIGEMEESDDLMYVTEYYLDFKPKNRLLKLLKDNFVLKSVSQDHIDICAINWKRCYTTNYDNSIELAARQTGKNIESLTTSDIPADFINKSDICLHINGKIEHAVESDLAESIKLSNSSYLSADSFVDSSWHYHFNQDLESCAAIIFVGYSMYDIDIQKILYQNPSFIEKTYFITREGSSHQDTYRLGKFGNILSIGVSGFARIAEECIATSNLKEDDGITEALGKFEIEEQPIAMRDSDVENFLLFGHISQGMLDNSLSGLQEVPFLINRTSLKHSIEFAKEGKSHVILGELGNGKSIFIKNLSSHLTIQGIDTYHLTDDYGDYLNDLNIIEKSQKKSVIIIDDYDKYYDLVQHFIAIDPQYLVLIITSRNSLHERHRTELSENCINFQEINLDILDDDELLSFIKIVDNIGMWGDKTNWSTEKKVRHFKQGYKSQLSLMLLDLFNSPHIKERVNKIVSQLFSHEKFKDTVFAIALAETLGIVPKASIIAEIALNYDIFSLNLKQHTAFKELFKIDNGLIKSKSSIFSLSLINNHFSSTYVYQQLLKVVKHFDSEERKTYEENLIFKSLLKFSFIERLLPQRQSQLNLYYEKLKINVPWLQRNPHFWVQFAMSRLTFGDYIKAQDYLDSAYSLASAKDNYHTENIDTQQARLFLLQCDDVKDNSKAFSYFKKANELIDSLSDDPYKFRQVIRYGDIYNNKFKYFSKKDRVYFEHSCKKRLSEIAKIEEDETLTASKLRFIINAKEILTSITEKIKLAR